MIVCACGTIMAEPYKVWAADKFVCRKCGAACFKTAKLHTAEHFRGGTAMTEQELALDYDDDGEYEGGERYCWACGGRGWRITCIDDLCHGNDECIHGDPPKPCRECNPKGEKEDSYL